MTNWTTRTLKDPWKERFWVTKKLDPDEAKEA